MGFFGKFSDSDVEALRAQVAELAPAVDVVTQRVQDLQLLFESVGKKVDRAHEQAIENALLVREMNGKLAIILADRGGLTLHNTVQGHTQVDQLNQSQTNHGSGPAAQTITGDTKNE